MITQLPNNEILHTQKYTYSFIATELVDLFSEKPQVKWFMIDGGDRNPGISLLLVILVQLLQKIQFGSR